jgi:hypothetical protein
MRDTFAMCGEPVEGRKHALTPILELRLFSADWHPQGGRGRWRGWWLRLPGGRSLV